MRDFIDPGVLGRLSALPLNARFAMSGNVSGRHRSQSRGSSLEFSEYRKYVPGDDTRRLDWRAWGRSDRYFIKEFEADTNLRLCLVIDTSGSMNYSEPIPSSARHPSEVSRIACARQLAGTLACLAATQGDAVGVYFSNSLTNRRIAPKRSSAHLRFILDELSAIRAEGTSTLTQTLHEVAEQIPRRALVVIISDLFVDSAELQSCFQHLRFRRHDVVLFHVLGRSELEFEFDRPVRFLDLEGAPPMLIDPVSVASRYREAIEEWMTEIRQTTRQSNVDYRFTTMDRSYEDVLAEFLIARQR
ncbi:MAG: DUF58 domain-containing protein [Planctomyces sp.]